MGIKDAIASVPIRPVMTVAVCMTVAVAAWHWGSVYNLCTDRADLSRSLKDWSQAALTSGTPTALDKATGFDWEHVRFAQGIPKPARSQNCPFDWHWNNDTREDMARLGNLTQIGFFKGKGIVAVADFDRRWARFATGEGPIARKDAVFAPSGEPRTLAPVKP